MAIYTCKSILYDMYVATELSGNIDIMHTKSAKQIRIVGGVMGSVSGPSKKPVSKSLERRVPCLTIFSGLQLIVMATRFGLVMNKQMR